MPKMRESQGIPEVAKRKNADKDDLRGRYIRTKAKETADHYPVDQSPAKSLAG